MEYIINRLEDDLEGLNMHLELAQQSKSHYEKQTSDAVNNIFMYRERIKETQFTLHLLKSEGIVK